MIFRSFGYFLEFPELFLNLKIPEKPLLRQHDIMLMSASQQGQSKSNLTGGSLMSVSQELIPVITRVDWV